VDELWHREGSGLREGFLIHAVEVINDFLEVVDVVGSLDFGEFGIILNLYQKEAVKAKADKLSTLLKKSPFIIDGTEYPVQSSSGFYEILAKASPDQMILAASEAARNNSGK
jgi:GGDEF domain-containing protein